MRIAFVSDSVYPLELRGLETLERAEADELAKRHELSSSRSAGRA